MQLIDFPFSFHWLRHRCQSNSGNRKSGVGHAVPKECGNARWVSLLDIGKLEPRLGSSTDLMTECHVHIFGRKRPVRSMYVRYESQSAGATSLPPFAF